jgi:hypothetical protein
VQVRPRSTASVLRDHISCEQIYLVDCQMAETNKVSEPITGPYLPRKEVIHPHLPVRIPCYDFIPVTTPTLGPSKVGTSGVGDFRDVTGGDRGQVISAAPHWTCASSASSESLCFRTRIHSTPFSVKCLLFLISSATRQNFSKSRCFLACNGYCLKNGIIFWSISLKLLTLYSTCGRHFS